MTEPEKNRTIGFTSFVCFVMLCSSLWFNLIRPFYYIIYLSAAVPSIHMHDKYLPTVYYTTMVLNEMTFCLFLGMAYIIISFDKVFKTRRYKVLNLRALNTSETLSKRSKRTKSRSLRRSNSDNTLYNSSPEFTIRAESRGERL